MKAGSRQTLADESIAQSFDFRYPDHSADGPSLGTENGTPKARAQSPVACGFSHILGLGATG